LEVDRVAEGAQLGDGAALDVLGSEVAEVLGAGVDVGLAGGVERIR
jgi:hypothetical protein